MKLARTPRSFFGLIAAAIVALAITGCDLPRTPGVIDTDIRTGLGEGYADPVGIFAIAMQPDGKVLLGGRFSSMDQAPHRGIARLNADGTVESTATFNCSQGGNHGVSGGTGIVNCVAVQADGKILIAGDFEYVAAEPRKRMARLNADGSLDPGFDPGAGADGPVKALAIQTDGKILMAGSFNIVDGQVRRGIARLEPDGGVDVSFETTVHGGVAALALQADGKILVGGFITTFANSVDRIGVIRLETSGEVDASFDVGVVNPHDIRCIAVQPDGKILIGGKFFEVQRTPRNGIARLNEDGTLDPFDATLDEITIIGGETTCNTVCPGCRCSIVSTIALQADGSILIGGEFSSTSEAVSRLARIFPFGSVDTSFRVERMPDQTVTSIAIRADGKILTAGGHYGRPLLQFHNTGAYQKLEALDNTGAFWYRGSTAPEVEQVTFEMSTDLGVSWTPLGPSTRFSSGWYVTGLSLPASCRIRARGRTVGGAASGSSGMVEQIAPFPADVIPPDTTIVSGPKGTLTTNAATFEFTSNEPYQRFTYSLDGGLEVETTATTASFAGLSQGEHTFRVFATDEGGNKDATPASRTWTVDATAPMPGSPDLSLIHAAPNAPFVNGPVDCIAVQPDGKILIAGSFTSVEGQPRHNLARFHPGGGLEDASTFDPGLGPNGSINAMVVQNDGRILIAGSFSEVNGLARNRIARLNPNGSVEATGTFNTGAGPDSRVDLMAVQRNGKILIAGIFQTVAGQPRPWIARLEVNGALDQSFALDPDEGGSFASMALLRSGEILVGGDNFTQNLAPVPPMWRLNDDGSRDAAFHPPISSLASVDTIAVQPDGRILVTGYFPGSGPPAREFVRLRGTDGDIESAETFNPGVGYSGIKDVILQADGKILIGGSFTTIAGQPRGGIARLHPDGSLESTVTFDTGVGAFNGAAPATVNVLALQKDGKVLLGGQFSAVGNRSFPRLARLNNSVPVESLSFAHSFYLTWLRDGSAPEVENVTFEFSSGGGGWTLLGYGTRTAGGWEVYNWAPRAGVTFRARGRTSRMTGNAGLVEQTFAPLSPFDQWRGQTFGQNADDPEISGAVADPDHDGASNLIEYAAGADPLDPNSRPRLTGSVEGGALSVTYERSKAATGVLFGMEQSADLQTWTPVSFTEQVLADDGTTRTIQATVSFDLSNPAASSGYLRGRISVAP